MPFDPTLRDRLCELETQDPLLRERCVEELEEMLEKKLSTPMKVFLGLVCAGSVAIATFLGTMGLIHNELPVVARTGIAGGVLFSLAWAGLAAWPLRRGSLPLLTQPAALAAVLWIFAVFLETCFLLVAPRFPDHFHALLCLFSGLVLLIGAGVMMVTTIVQQAALRTQETLLRLEYRIAAAEKTSGAER